MSSIALTPARWQSPVGDGGFNGLVATALLLTLLLAWYVTQVVLPPLTQAQKRELPPQLTQLIEKVQLQEKPEPEPIKPEEPKPEPEPQEVSKEPVKTAITAVEKAKDQAKKSGLLAMADDLAAMRDSFTPTTTQLPSQSVQQVSQTLAANNQIDTVSAKTNQRVAVAATQAQDLGQVALADKSLIAVSDQVATSTVQGTEQQTLLAKDEVTAGKVNLEQIRAVLDQNKGAIYSLYRRALRADPALAGKVTVAISIDADGRVSKCDVVSSELNNPELLQKLVARIKLIQFGKLAQATSLTYAFNFLPY